MMSKMKNLVMDVINDACSGIPVEDVAEKYGLTVLDVEILLKECSDAQPTTNMFGTPV